MVDSIADKIVCSRYNNAIPNLIAIKDKIRIGSISPKRINAPNYTLISTDGTRIYHNDEIFTVREYFNKIPRNPLMVLTCKEYGLLHDIAIEYSVKVCIFENLFPIFPNIKFISDIKKSYRYLLSLYEIVKNSETHGVPFSKYYATKFLYKTERKLKFKNSLDIIFAHAYKSGFQEVFKLQEVDAKRNVVALDFNSMYASCMLEKFMEPKSLKYITVTDLENYSDALIHVTLKEPNNDFIKNFHPFRYTRLFKSQTYKLDANSSIETQLFKDEFLYYKQFFKYYEIHSAISSKEMIWHPLRRDAINLYRERLNVVGNYKSIKEKTLKYQLATMHSCTNQKKFRNLKNQTTEDLKRLISEKFLLTTTEYDDFNLVKDIEAIQIEKQDNLYNAKIVNLESHSNIFSMSARITARAELALFKMMRKLINFNTVELCYCNIDSIHISLESRYKKAFFEEFKAYIGSDMGQLKVETITDNGYWFDIGRYWLIDNKDVRKFANISFNRQGYVEPFIFNKKIHKHIKGELIEYSDISYRSVMSSFSYKKRLDIDSNTFERYSFSEIKDLSVAKQTYLNEKRLTNKLKSHLIKSLPSKCAFTL